MFDRSLVLEQIAQAEEAIRRIERRFKDITSPDNFVSNDEGLDRLDAIAMMLITIGESIKKIGKVTSGRLFQAFPEIHWPGVKGTRDILAHDYFGIDQEEIYNICVDDLVPLKKALQKMREEI